MLTQLAASKCVYTSFCAHLTRFQHLLNDFAEIDRQYRLLSNLVNINPPVVHCEHGSTSFDAPLLRPANIKIWTREKNHMPESNFAESFKLRCTNDTINFVLISIICSLAREKSPASLKNESTEKKREKRSKKNLRHKTVHFASCGCCKAFTLLFWSWFRCRSLD